MAELTTWNATHHVPHDSALSVGAISLASSKAEEDAAHIKDLEDEVRILADKANTASQRFADYENEIRVLEAKLRQEQRKNSATTTISEASETPPLEKPNISRFGSFMGKRSPALAQTNGVAGAHLTNSREKELEEKLVKEQTTRIAAEKKVKEVNAEIEDLSATLFEQANEMVSTERKENAALKERIEALEAQRQQKEVELEALRQAQEQQQKRSVTEDRQKDIVKVQQSEALQKENAKLKEKIRQLEQREADRKRRIERLEAANRRIERVRAMLQPP